MFFFCSEAILQIFSLKKRGIKLLGTINTIIISFAFLKTSSIHLDIFIVKGRKIEEKKLKPIPRFKFRK